MTLSEIHKEIHGKLMQRKNPNILWGSPFDNAWVGFVFCDHKKRDEVVLREMLEYLRRWTLSPNFLREERNVGAVALYTAILTALRDELKGTQLQPLIREKLLELDKKEKGKFSLFNSPEIFYSTVTGLASSGFLKNDDELKSIVYKYVKQEIDKKWLNRIYRFALYSAAAFELQVDLPLKDKILTFLSSISVKELRVDEVVPLIWFLTKYNKDIMNLVARRTTLRKLLEEKKGHLWEQFENQRIYFEYEATILDEEAEIGSTYSLSTFELAMIDDMLACAEKVYRVDPNEVFDLLQLHPVIKKVSEKLFKNGHYAQAIFEAYKALNSYVKRRSGRKDLDGTDLMAKVFGFDYDRATGQIKRRPLLQLNELREQSERDEQQGFIHLFMGSMQGVRNPKAHDLIEQKDPFRTLEYLGFASLLIKRVSGAKRTKTMS